MFEDTIHAINSNKKKIRDLNERILKMLKEKRDVENTLDYLRKKKMKSNMTLKGFGDEK
jgi:hypothetical protein